MGLVVNTLENNILGIITDMRSKTVNVDAEFAKRLAAAIHAYIQSAEVTGACATPAGPGTIKGTLI